MSFGGIRVFNGVLDLLVLVLMMVAMLALLYADISLTYKVFIGAVSFLVFILITLATQILRQQKELHKQRMKQA
jgi:hypothetical protein